MGFFFYTKIENDLPHRFTVYHWFAVIYIALMMQKQMIMEQYRNNRTLNSCFFLFLQRCKSNWVLHHKHNRLMKWLLSSQNVSTIIYYLQITCYTSDLSCIGSSNNTCIYCSIKINSPQLYG